MPVTSYLLAPLIGWFAAGTLKFGINSLLCRRLAWERIGYGGMPSTHSAIVSTTAVLIGLREGWDTPAFSIAATLTVVVAVDALGLRREVGRHAAALNRILDGEPGRRRFRERMGHRKTEVLAGLLTGAACAHLLHALLP